MFFFRHSITKSVCDSSLIIAGWLSARFCVWLFCAGEPRPQTWVLSTLWSGGLCTEKLFPQGVRCRASRPADPAKEGLSWNCLYSNFSLKPPTKKCKLNHLRSDSSSVSVLKFLSRMVRIEPSWGKKSRGTSARRATGSPRHMRAGGEAVMVLVEFCMRVCNKQIQPAFS